MIAQKSPECRTKKNFDMTSTAKPCLACRFLGHYAPGAADLLRLWTYHTTNIAHIKGASDKEGKAVWTDGVPSV
jgi:hypothetical protein